MTLGRADSTLLDRVGADQVSKASGPEEEVIRLIDQLRSPLLRYVFSIGLSIEDSEEVTQEVFLALFQHLRQGKSRHNLRGWIFRVGHKIGLKRRAVRDTHRLEQTESRAFDQLRDPAPDPEAALAARQKQERLLGVFNALPERDRCCLNLRAEGLRYREIAQVQQAAK